MPLKAIAERLEAIAERHPILQRSIDVGERRPQQRVAEFQLINDLISTVSTPDGSIPVGDSNTHRRVEQVVGLLRLIGITR